MTLFVAILSLVAIAMLFGILLGYSAIKFKLDGDPIIDSIDEILPQTQCGQCGYPGCRPYAEAIAKGEAINKCPPGGETGVKHLADLLGREIIPLEEEDEEKKAPSVVIIREADCIGCTKCIQACPVDAIVGSAKMMHTILIDECTGCDLCIPPCPVDCIDIVYIPVTTRNWKAPEPDALIPIVMVES
jgi:electron transport complex protein RnfB